MDKYHLQDSLGKYLMGNWDDEINFFCEVSIIILKFLIF